MKKAAVEPDYVAKNLCANVNSTALQAEVILCLDHDGIRPAERSALP